jgi:hypothetical protein
MTEHTSNDHARLRELAAALPREIAPPPDLWPAIRAELTPHPARPAWWAARWRLAAAGLLIAVGSSIATLIAVRSSERGGGQRVAAHHDSAVSTGAELPAHLVVAVHGYTRSIEALRRTLDERRDSLAPSTIATVERSARIADSAIAEARAALERDPAKRVLEELLLSNYERKVDLLQRATELAPRT